MRLEDPQKHAVEAAGLRYVRADDPGLKRVRRGGGFVYMDGATGRRVTSEAVLRRVAALVIPPAWREVWICRHALGHIQATGIDAKGRKQYRYHAQWTSSRNLAKFAALSHVGSALPKIRRRVSADLRLSGIPRRRVLACMVRLLDERLIRIGNSEYAKAHAHFGLATIRNDHARVRGRRVRLDFVGKSGQPCETEIESPLIAEIVANCQGLPGEELFCYIDDGSVVRDVTSADVNAYLAEISGEALTAKDFRTWGGTVVAARELQRFAERDAQTGAVPGATELKRRERAAVRAAAAALANTVATCRKFYVHPDLVTAHADGSLAEAFRWAARARGGAAGLRLAERAVLRWLRMRVRTRRSAAA